MTVGQVFNLSEFVQVENLYYDVGASPLLVSDLAEVYNRA